MMQQPMAGDDFRAILHSPPRHAVIICAAFHARERCRTAASYLLGEEYSEHRRGIY
jgi:hypothetical protein